MDWKQEFENAKKMFNDEVNDIICSIKKIHDGGGDIPPECLIQAMKSNPEFLDCINDFLGNVFTKFTMTDDAPLSIGKSCSYPKNLSPELTDLFRKAGEFAIKHNKGVIDRRVLVAMLFKHKTTRDLIFDPYIDKQIEDWFCNKYSHLQSNTATMAPMSILEKLKGLRDFLNKNVFGQQHVVSAVLDSIFGAALLSESCASVRGPQDLILFAGPPGVGKTHTAKCIADFLERPFRIFDMNLYSSDTKGDFSRLIGIPEPYQGFGEGHLTGFVRKNPNAILLLDEIEKTDSTTISFLLQLLDSGEIEDKCLNRRVDFRKTIIIATTNAGRAIYDNPRHRLFMTANPDIQQNILIEELERERNPMTLQPVFPMGVCSRMAKGRSVIFRHLGPYELIKIAEKSLSEQPFKCIGETLDKTITIDRKVLACLVLAEGPNVDARNIISKTRKFVENSLRKVIQATDLSSQKWNEVKEIMYMIGSGKKGDSDLKSLMSLTGLSEVKTEEVCCIGFGKAIMQNWLQKSSTIKWKFIDYITDVVIDEVKNLKPVLILINLFTDMGSPPPADVTIMGYKILGSANISYRNVFDLIKKLSSAMADTPIIIYSHELADNHFTGTTLLEECMSLGNVRTHMPINIDSNKQDNNTLEASYDLFTGFIEKEIENIYLEKAVKSLKSRRQQLFFDVSDVISSTSQNQLWMRLRDFAIKTVIAAKDSDIKSQEADDLSAFSFDDVMGCQAVKDSLEFVITWMREYTSMSANDVDRPRGFLFAGPPGTGKTLIAKAVAGMAGCRMIARSATSMMSSYVNGGVNNLIELFDQARRYAPSFIFIDEIDAIGSSRQTAVNSTKEYTNMLMELLNQMDGFNTGDQPPVVVLAATNHVESLDPALLRRFDEIIEFPLPAEAERKQFLERLLRGISVGPVCIENLAKRTSGLNYADLERIVAKAKRLTTIKGVNLSDDHLEDAANSICFGEVSSRLFSPRDKEQTAWHESGHAVMCFIEGKPILGLSIKARRQNAGMVLVDPEEHRSVYTKSDCEKHIRILLGGYAAEQIFSGDISGGASQDIERAYYTARNMVTKSGMYGLDLVNPGDRNLSESMKIQIDEKASNILKEQLEKTTVILSENKTKLEGLVQEAMLKERLLPEEIAKIMV